jgi:parvulin-like peptidyl-prolyl isomerase
VTDLVKTLRTAPIALLALVLAVALVGTSCSSVDPVALQVGQWQLSSKDFQDQLEAYADAVVAAGGERSTVEGTTSNTWSTKTTAEILSYHLEFQLAAQALAERGLEVTDDDRATTRTNLSTTSSGGESILTSMSEELQDFFVDGFATVNKLGQDIVDEASSDEGLREVYDADPSQFDEVCVSHILVFAGQADGETVPSDADYADALERIERIQDELTGTSNFAAVAAESSEDSNSAPDGGSLGCNAASAFAVDGFKEAVASQPVGVVGDPVKSIYGYQLVLVTSRTPQSFEDVKDLVASTVQQNPDAIVEAELVRLAAAADVSVNGRYGQLDLDTATIVAPAGADQPGTSDSSILLGTSSQ